MANCTEFSWRHAHFQGNCWHNHVNRPIDSDVGTRFIRCWCVCARTHEQNQEPEFAAQTEELSLIILDFMTGRTLAQASAVIAHTDKHHVLQLRLQTCITAAFWICNYKSCLNKLKL